VKPFPIILVGKDYWKDLIKWIKNKCLKSDMIDKIDLDIFTIIDNPKKIVKFVDDYYSRKGGK